MPSDKPADAKTRQAKWNQQRKNLSCYVPKDVGRKFAKKAKNHKQKVAARLKGLVLEDVKGEE